VGTAPMLDADQGLDQKEPVPPGLSTVLGKFEQRERAMATRRDQEVLATRGR